MNRILFVVTLVFLLSLLTSAMFAGCVSEEEILQEPNVFCQNQAPFICDGSKLKVCGIDGKWAYEECNSICEEIGLSYSGVCEFDSDRGHDFCKCGDNCCEKGTTRCSGDKLETCDDNCSYNSIECETYCDTIGSDTFSCEISSETDKAACVCGGTAVINLCTANVIKCGEGYTNICLESASYSSVDCREKCEEKGYYFSYCEITSDPAKETCHCSTREESEDCKNTKPTCDGDKISFCEKNKTTELDCNEVCTDLGLDYASCKEDKDRGHDACFCIAKAADGDE